MSPKEIRTAAGLPRIVVAVRAGVAEPTVRLYEADRLEVSPLTRGKLDPLYAALRSALPAAQ